MKVLIDGKEVECLNDVKVIYEDIDEKQNDLHVTLNKEGMINDLVDKGGDVAESYWGEPWHIAEDLCH